MQNKNDHQKLLLAHPRMATVSPSEMAILPSFTRHYVKDGIGVIPVKGFLSSDLMSWFGLSYAQLQSVLKKFEDDSEVNGVLLTLDSCGGDAAGAFEFAEMINSFSKPIETYIEAEASSSGYLISAATKHITMHKSAFAGSIGAVVSAWKFNDVKEKIIVNTQSPFKYSDPFDDAGAARITNILNQIADGFINDVAKYRKTDSNNVQTNYGQGDVLFAKQALSVGMIDSVGNMQTALTHLMSVINPEQKNNNPKSKSSDKNNLSSNLKTGAKKIKRGKRYMARRIKTAFVFIDDSEIPEGATTITDVTIETLDENFPELMEQVRQAVRDEIAAEDQAVNDASEDADMADTDEAEAVAAARKREITPEQLTQKLLKIKTEKLKSPETLAANELQKRIKDNPEMAASVGTNGTDLLEKTACQRNGEGTASRVKNLRKSRGTKK